MPPNRPPPTELDKDIPCIRCQYNLRGLPVDGDCPECATPLRHSIGFYPSDRIPDSPVEADTPCIRCRYNLRGLFPSAICPECGTPILHTLHADRLIYSTPHYLARINSALLILVTTWVAGFVLSLVLGSALPGAWNPTAGVVALPIASVVVQTLFAGATAFGFWRFTEPDSSQRSSNRAEKTRNTIRVASLFIFCLRVLTLAVAIVLASSPMTDAALLVLGLPVFIATPVLNSAAFLYTNWLAGRVPNRSLALRATVLAVLAPLLYLGANAGALCLGFSHSTFLSAGYLANSALGIAHFLNVRAHLKRVSLAAN